MTAASVIYKDLMQAQGGGARPRVEQKFPNPKWHLIWKTFAITEIPSEWLAALYLFLNDQFSYAVKTFAHGISATDLCTICGVVDERHHRLVTCTGEAAFQWCNGEIRRLFGLGCLGIDGLNDVLGLSDMTGRSLALRWLVAGLVYFNLVRKGDGGVQAFREMLREQRFLSGNRSRKFGRWLMRLKV